MPCRCVLSSEYVRSITSERAGCGCNVCGNGDAGLQEVLLGDLLALVEKELHVIGVLMVASSLLQFLGVTAWPVLVHLSSTIISLPFLTATCLFSGH